MNGYLTRHIALRATVSFLNEVHTLSYCIAPFNAPCRILSYNVKCSHITSYQAISTSPHFAMLTHSKFNNSCTAILDNIPQAHLPSLIFSSPSARNRLLSRLTRFYLCPFYKSMTLAPVNNRAQYI